MADTINGIIINVKSFSGWDSFSALITHLKFIKEQQNKVSHVAFVMDSPLGEFAEHVANHFVNAEIRNFSFNELQSSINWILSDDSEWEK